jgi:hypothetical protein
MTLEIRTDPGPQVRTKTNITHNMSHLHGWV